MPADSLLLETEFLDDRRVATLVILLKVAKVASAVGNHLKKAASRMEILLVTLEVSCQLLDLSAKDSHLYAR